MFAAIQPIGIAHVEQVQFITIYLTPLNPTPPFFCVQLNGTTQVCGSLKVFRMNGASSWSDIVPFSMKNQCSTAL